MWCRPTTTTTDTSTCMCCRADGCGRARSIRTPCSATAEMEPSRMSPRPQDCCRSTPTRPRSGSTSTGMAGWTSSWGTRWRIGPEGIPANCSTTTGMERSPRWPWAPGSGSMASPRGPPSGTSTMIGAPTCMSPCWDGPNCSSGTMAPERSRTPGSSPMSPPPPGSRNPITASNLVLRLRPGRERGPVCRWISDPAGGGRGRRLSGTFEHRRAVPSVP